MGVHDFTSVGRFSTRVTFRVLVDAVPAEQAVFVCGAAEALGNWSIHRAIRLHESEEHPGAWSTVDEIALPLKRPVEYNYVIKDSVEREVRWVFPENFCICPSGLEMVKEDDGGVMRLHGGSHAVGEEVLLDREEDDAAYLRGGQHTYSKEDALERLARLKPDGMNSNRK